MTLCVYYSCLINLRFFFVKKNPHNLFPSQIKQSINYLKNVFKKKKKTNIEACNLIFNKLIAEQIYWLNNLKYLQKKGARAEII